MCWFVVWFVVWGVLLSLVFWVLLGLMMFCLFGLWGGFSSGFVMCFFITRCLGCGLLLLVLGWGWFDGCVCFDVLEFEFRLVVFCCFVFGGLFCLVLGGFEFGY